MESFQRYLGDDDYLLDDTVALLRSTSVKISTFRDHRPVADIKDKRLDGIMSALAWFNEWESSVKKQKLSPPEEEKYLMSSQTRKDLNSCIIGFNNLCKTTLESHRNSIVHVPARIKSDVIENIFCQQRGIINRNNTNPTFYQYVKNINAIIIRQMWHNGLRYLVVWWLENPWL